MMKLAIMHASSAWKSELDIGLNCLSLMMKLAIIPLVHELDCHWAKLLKPHDEGSNDACGPLKFQPALDRYE